MRSKRIYLSPPNVGSSELEQVQDTFDSGWVAPVGPSLEAFEKQLERRMGGKSVLALNSGTSALHLALILAGVRKDDEVVVSTFTFAACGNVVRYQHATPVFMDSEEDTWGLDPELLSQYLSKTPILPKAVIATHLYGVPAKVEELKKVCEEYDVVLIEDAAEALGSTLRGQQVGTFGSKGIISFNGNKIITTSGGGALIGNSEDYSRGLYLSTQANRGTIGYDHHEVGYNYRMSNVLARIGLGQLSQLEEFISTKRTIAEYYEQHLPARIFEFPKEPSNSRCNRWLTTPMIKAEYSELIKPEDLIQFLDKNGVETRMLWKPLHLHPAFSAFKFYGEGVAEKIFERGLCLPSGTNLSEADQSLVCELIHEFVESV